MKKKTTKRAKKATIRDLPAKKAAAAVKGGTRKETCWFEGPGTAGG